MRRAKIIESYAVTHMGHGTPLATGAADGEMRRSRPLLLDEGISSSYSHRKFFGLA